MLLTTLDMIRTSPRVLTARQINRRSFKVRPSRMRMPILDEIPCERRRIKSIQASRPIFEVKEVVSRTSIRFDCIRYGQLPTYHDESLYTPRIPVKPPCQIRAAIVKNGWDPACPPKMKSGHYMDPRELLYRTLRVQLAGGVDKAGIDGERFVALLQILANGYMGRILFRDQGQMANLTEDMVAEAVAKCCLIVTRFAAWELDRKTGKPSKRALSVQWHRMPSGKHELNAYIS
jgi:hypothetical protein